MFIGRSRAAVVVSAAARKVSRWRPDLRIDISEPPKPGDRAFARIRRPGHAEIELPLPFTVDEHGLRRWPQPGPRDGRAELHPLETLDDRALELLDASPRMGFKPRGFCPRCSSRDVVHVWFGFPPGPVDIWWIHLQGCLVGPWDDPSLDRRCLACGEQWWSRRVNQTTVSP